MEIALGLMAVRSASGAASERAANEPGVLPPMDLALRVQRGPLQMGATRSSACVRGAPLFVLIRRLPFFLLPESGERKDRGGWARPAAPRPCSRGPEVPRPHPGALRSLVCCGAGRFGAGVRGTCCSALPCASGRGHSLHDARKCRPGARGTRAPHVRPRPPSRQSRGLWAIHRFSRPAMPFLLPPLCPNTGRETPVSPGEGASGVGLLQPGSPLPCRPEPPAPGWSSPLPLIV